MEFLRCWDSTSGGEIQLLNARDHGISLWHATTEANFRKIMAQSAGKTLSGLLPTPKNAIDRIHHKPPLLGEAVTSPSIRITILNLTD